MLEAPEVVAEPFAPEDAVAFPTAPSIPSGVVDVTPLPSDEDTALLVRKGARLADDFIAGVLAEGWASRGRPDLPTKVKPAGKAPAPDPARLEEEVAEQEAEDEETRRKAKEAREELEKKGPPPSSSSSAMLESVEGPAEQSVSEDAADAPAAQSAPSEIVDSTSLPSDEDIAFASTVRKGARLAEAFLAGVVAEGWTPRGRPDSTTKPKKAGKVPPPDPARLAEEKAKQKKEDDEKVKKAKKARDDLQKKGPPPPPPSAGASLASSSTSRTRL